jgi:hypothetical protein
VVGSSEHRNRPSDYLQCGEFLDWLSVLSTSMKDCSVELVNFTFLNPSAPSVLFCLYQVRERRSERRGETACLRRGLPVTYFSTSVSIHSTKSPKERELI